MERQRGREGGGKKERKGWGRERELEETERIEVLSQEMVERKLSAPSLSPSLLQPRHARQTSRRKCIPWSVDSKLLRGPPGLTWPRVLKHSSPISLTPPRNRGQTEATSPTLKMILEIQKKKADVPTSP